MSSVWSQQRGYRPGAPLYARMTLKFSGRVVEHGALIPAEYIRSAEQHATLWRAGHAGHEPRPAVKQPFRPSTLDEVMAMQSPPPSQAAPAAPPVTVQSPEASFVAGGVIVVNVTDERPLTPAKPRTKR